MNTAADAAVQNSILSDPRFERLLAIGKEINDLLYKIAAASSYLAKGDSKDVEEVEIARNQLARDLARDFSEANDLMPSVDEAITKLSERKQSLENVLKMNVGLARIEGLSGTDKQKMFEETAAETKLRISEIDHLVKALDALQSDLGTRRNSAHVCPRCSSPKVSYRITPSELGFSLYKCENCGNSWKITQFSTRVKQEFTHLP